MRLRGRARWQSQSGQAIVLFVVILPVMIGMAGLVTDVGYWYVSKRQAQNAADAAALAAANELPNAFTADMVGRTYVNYNVTGSTTTVTAPYSSDPNKVEVKVKISREAFFSRLFGVGTVAINARAVGTKKGGALPMAIYNHSSDCAGGFLKMNGQNFHINGHVHTNGMVEVDGQQSPAPDNIDGLTYSGTGPACEPKINDTRPNRVQATQAPSRSWPIYIDFNSYVPATCDVISTAPTLTYNHALHNNKVVCAQDFKFSDDNTTATITVFATNKIEVDANHLVFTPKLDGILFASRGAPGDVFTINGNNSTFSGVIFNEFNLIKFNGNSGTAFEGVMEGERVELNGNSMTFEGTGPPVGESGVALAE
jgi:hypothetical protein